MFLGAFYGYPSEGFNCKTKFNRRYNIILHYILFYIKNNNILIYSYKPWAHKDLIRSSNIRNVWLF